MALGWSFQGDPHLSSAGSRAKIAVGVWFWLALEMAHLMDFLARGVGIWWRIWNPVQGVENQVPEAAGCGVWVGGVRKLEQPGVMLMAVAVVSVQSGWRVRRAVMIQAGISAGLWPSDLLVRR